MMTDQLDSLGIQFNLELTKYAFDCMCRENNVSNAIYNVLQRVGTFYQLNHITVFEKSSHLQCFNISYEWCNQTIKPKLNHIFTFSDEFRNFFFNSNQAHEILTIHDIKQYDQNHNISKMFEQNHSTHYLCLGISNNNKNNGIICFETDQDIEEFSENQIACFFQTKELIENYFFTMQSYKEYERKLEQVTLYDPITGLLKYEMFLQQSESIYQKDSSNKNYFIFYADIDSFKFFNEKYGYAAGDDVLRLFEQHFMTGSSYHMIGSRLFSDYFIAMCVLDHNFDYNKIIKYVETQNRLFSKKIQKTFPDAKLGIAAGVSLINDKQISIKTYIDNANQARKLAKKMKQCCAIYSEQMEEAKKRSVHMANRAEDALKNCEFYFLLQPKTDLESKKIVGAEALVRWKESDGTMIYPNDFIPLFEENGFIVQLDFYVYNKVCEYLHNQIINHGIVVPISVNVSRVHLNRNDFVRKVIKVVDQYQIPHELLEFELTESVFLQNSFVARDMMHDLKSAGFKVSMDDFGSGYSSLNLLTTLEFDILKLDKGFLSDEMISTKDKVVIQSIIQMAKLMNMAVLCEGVEREDQVEELANLHCDLAQGYYFGRPMTVSDFNELYISVTEQ